MRKGTVVDGRFELLSQASKGGMGSVYRSRDLHTQKIVALKVLRLERPSDLARFQRESVTLSNVHHPNVVGYVSHGIADSVHYLAEEWVDGITLSVHQRSVGTTVREAVTIAKGVAFALAATHTLGVIHRDIKPSNIILAGGSPDAVKVVDFGIARLANEAGVLTRTGVMLGTPSYMSPEQARGQMDIDCATDVWSLGCVLYEGLTGRLAFAGKTAAAIRAKLLLSEPAPIEPMCPEAPAELVALISAMLEKDPAKRIANAGDLLARMITLPALPDDERRRHITHEPATKVMPVRNTKVPVDNGPSSFVFLSTFDPPQSDEHDKQLAEVAERHDMDVHVFEEGSALLASRQPGKSGAMEAAKAALEVRERFDGGVSLFGQAFNDTLEEAIDRGSELLERATMGSLFGDASADDPDPRPVVLVDNVIAELVCDQLPLEDSADGQVLRVGARRG